MNTVTSKDGTTIAYRTIGNGPSVIIVPGALGLTVSFLELAEELGQRFTVYTIERRGRGDSGPQGDDYSITKEYEDILALQAETGAKYIFGHSFGGLIVLETALRADIFDKLVVYEPGVSIDDSIDVSWISLSKKQLAQGRFLDAFITFVKSANPQFAKMPNWLLGPMLRMAVKKQEYTLFPSTICEHVEIARLNNTYERYSKFTASVLLLRGGKGTMAETTSKLAVAMPHSKLVTLSTLNHLAPVRKPHQIVQELILFFGS